VSGLTALRRASEHTRLPQHEFKRTEVRDARLEEVEPHEGREEQEAGIIVSFSSLLNVTTASSRLRNSGAKNFFKSASV
jgi:hypothetical protein